MASQLLSKSLSVAVHFGPGALLCFSPPFTQPLKTTIAILRRRVSCALLALVQLAQAGPSPLRDSESIR